MTVEKAIADFPFVGLEAIGQQWAGAEKTTGLEIAQTELEAASLDCVAIQAVTAAEDRVIGGVVGTDDIVVEIEKGLRQPATRRRAQASQGQVRPFGKGLPQQRQIEQPFAGVTEYIKPDAAVAGKALTEALARLSSSSIEISARSSVRGGQEGCSAERSASFSAKSKRGRIFTHAGTTRTQRSSGAMHQFTHAHDPV